MAYSVKTEQFNGPLDVLLSLIEKRKLFINEISLAKVTDDFLEYIKSHNEFPLGESSHFILIASTLLLIKSRSLLPNLELTTEEEASIDDLENRLREYKRIQELSLHIRNAFGKNILFTKIPNKNIKPVFSPDDKTTVSNIALAIKSVLHSLPKIEKLPQVLVKKVISLEETILKLTERVQNGLRMSFKDFSKIGSEEKVNVIVSFLAMLELVRQGMIRVEQDGMFDDIQMETEGLGVPKYN